MCHAADPGVIEVCQDRRGMIRRGIVQDDQLEVVEGLAEDARDGRAEEFCSVERGDDRRHPAHGVSHLDGLGRSTAALLPGESWAPSPYHGWPSCDRGSTGSAPRAGPDDTPGWPGRPEEPRC